MKCAQAKVNCIANGTTSNTSYRRDAEAAGRASETAGMTKEEVGRASEAADKPSGIESNMDGERKKTKLMERFPSLRPAQPKSVIDRILRTYIRGIGRSKNIRHERIDEPTDGLTLTDGS